MTAGKNDADDLSMGANKFVLVPLSDEPSLFAIRGPVIDAKLGLVAIPRIVATGQAFDIALVADGIVRGNEDRAEDFDSTCGDSRRAEQTCRPEPELSRLRARQLAEERKKPRPAPTDDAVAGRHTGLKFVVELCDCADVAGLQAERLQIPIGLVPDLIKASVTNNRRAASSGSSGRGKPACARLMAAVASSPLLQLFAARSMLPSTDGEIALPKVADSRARSRASSP